MNKRLVIGYALIVALAVVPRVFVIPGALKDVTMFPFIAIAAILFMAIALVRPIWLVATRHPAPLSQLVEDVRANWVRIGLTALVVVSVTQTLETATLLKQQIPDVQPYYLDGQLIALDRLLFQGIDPWRVTHAVIGPLGTAVIDHVYSVWHLIQIGFAIWIALMPDRDMQVRAAVSFQLCWLLLGSLLATALASVGPCFVGEFFGDNTFDPLLEELDGSRSAMAMEYLLATRGTDAVGAGISAMPSMHVSIAVLVALYLNHRSRRLAIAGWGFAAFTYIGSIHLGWHYATDGIVGGAGALLVWWAVGRVFVPGPVDAPAKLAEQEPLPTM